MRCRRPARRCSMPTMTFCGDWIARAPCEFKLTFGFDVACRLHGLADEPRLDADGMRFTMRLPDGEVLADSSTRCSAGRTSPTRWRRRPRRKPWVQRTDDIATGSARARAVSGRLKAVPGLRGAVIFDDSYNANPGSVRAALDYLATLSGRRVLVLGDMAELGTACNRAASRDRRLRRAAAATCSSRSAIARRRRLRRLRRRGRPLRGHRCCARRSSSRCSPRGLRCWSRARA